MRSRPPFGTHRAMAAPGTSRRHPWVAALALALVPTCALSHARSGDAGASDVGPRLDAGCAGEPRVDCTACGGVVEPSCEGGEWVCPEPPRSCPFACSTPPPSPECSCAVSTWVCPDLSCPAETAPLIGTACATAGAVCGNVCCSTGIECTEGRWRDMGGAACACADWPCGPGACRDDQYCRIGCGPDDGLAYTCEVLPACGACDCIAVPPGSTCEMVDGHPVVREPGLCG